MRGAAAAVLSVLFAAGLWHSNSRAADANAASSTDLSPDDFAYGVMALAPGEAVAYRAPLPLAVYQKVVRGDLGDVRMFNERNEPVPYRIERPTSQSAVPTAPVSLPVFKLRDGSREALDAIRVRIEGGGSRIDVQAPASAGTPGASSSPVASYVLDGRSLQAPVATFQLTWPENATDFAGRLRIEASDDLGSWRTAVTGAPVANLRAGDARLIEQRIELAGVSAKFWRLSWADAPAPFEITAVIAEPARDRVDVPRTTLAVPGIPVGGRRGEFQFDLGARAPVDRVNLELPEQNSIVEVELLSRTLPSQPWRPVTRGGFYRLKSTRPVSAGDSPAVETNADLTNGSLAIEPSSDRYWLARVDTRSGGLGAGIPKLRVGWLPHDVVFLARGTGPFTLAYGSGKAQPTAALGAIPGNVFIVNATFSEPEPLGGDARLVPVAPPRSVWSKPAILWSVLAIGVVLLAVMAYRLAKELK
jgi:hypothetical protein